MKFNGSIRLVAMASVAVLSFAPCSDTSISSPGVADIPPPPSTPPPPPTPPAASTINLIPSAGCPAGTSELTLSAIAADGFSDTDVCALNGSITTNLTIPENTTVALSGPVFVGEDGGVSATLTVGSGVTFFGASEQGSSTATDDYLIISRGSSIDAVGTAAAPIRFTARGVVNDEQTGTSTVDQLTSEGLWGGLVINGFAPINACEDTTATGGSAGCQKSGEGSTGFFGGDASGDSSGTLQFVTVEYALSLIHI